ncbi:MAG: hypothetical protein IJV00_04750 [Clostridia bacterium]|nr:hypothetical protein [Clostridia bacterium]
MDFYIITSDPRYAVLSDLLERDGERAIFCDVSDAADLPKGVFLPSPGMGREEQEKLLSLAAPGSVVLGGRLGAKGSELCAIRGITYRELESDLSYAEKNARLTAEGCLSIILESTPFCLFSCPVLVTGFGKVGGECARLLRRCGASVSVCVRAGKSFDAAADQNFPVFCPGEEPECRPWRVIVNTVEKEGFVGAGLLDGCRKLYLVLDLASGKNNLDLPLLERLGVRAGRAPALPGKTAPESAAGYLYQAVKSFLRREKT